MAILSLSYTFPVKKTPANKPTKLKKIIKEPLKEIEPLIEPFIEPIKEETATGIKKFEPFKGTRDSGKLFIQGLTSNPLANVIKNSYSFFYWLPRKNIPFDTPWKLFGNTTAQFIAWYQWPHNLPPYIYLSDGQEPKDFFCWGLPGTTLPLGNWDPMFLQNTSKDVMKKYRESELKHGRLAMMAVVGFLGIRVMVSVRDKG